MKKIFVTGIVLLQLLFVVSFIGNLITSSFFLEKSKKDTNVPLLGLSSKELIWRTKEVSFKDKESLEYLLFRKGLGYIPGGFGESGYSSISYSNFVIEIYKDGAVFLSLIPSIKFNNKLLLDEAQRILSSNGKNFGDGYVFYYTGSSFMKKGLGKKKYLGKLSVNRLWLDGKHMFTFN